MQTQAQRDYAATLVHGMRRSAGVLAIAVSTALSGCFLDFGDDGGSSGSAGSTTATASGGMNNPANPAAPSAMNPATPAPTPPQQTIPPSAPPPAMTATPTTRADAVRYLQQAAFGPNETAIAEVMQKGAALMIEEEFAKPGMGLQPMAAVDPDSPKQCPDTLSSAERQACERDNYTAFPLQRQFFANAVGGSDQLRQRVAFALSQIIVTSMNGIDQTYAMRNFQQMLLENAFGNYRDILMKTTLSPTMGKYLDMANNQKPDPARGIEPNENYAREILQLFSIGEYVLNPDGTRQMANGAPVPTYDQAVIENFSRVFTGWTYPTRPGQQAKFPNPEHFQGDMIEFPAQHDTGAKVLLGGAQVAANQTMTKDLNDAIDNVFNHPNVGPYIGKQLIQMLVTSNPTPEYVGRVTTAFNNNGQGVRGDMKAVIRAILRDAEARGDAKTDANYGKLQEPVLYLTGVVRGLNGATDGVFLRDRAGSLGQNPYESPTVFNFYPPDYPAPGQDVLGPQFKIVSTTTTLARANVLHELLVTRGENVPAATNVAGATGTQTRASTTWNALAANPTALVDQVATAFGNNTLSTTEKQAIVTAVNAVAASNAAQRVRTAVYLAATAPQTQVTK